MSRNWCWRLDRAPWCTVPLRLACMAPTRRPLCLATECRCSSGAGPRAGWLAAWLIRDLCCDSCSICRADLHFVLSTEWNIAVQPYLIIIDDNNNNDDDNLICPVRLCALVIAKSPLCILQEIVFFCVFHEKRRCGISLEWCRDGVSSWICDRNETFDKILSEEGKTKCRTNLQKLQHIFSCVYVGNKRLRRIHLSLTKTKQD